MTVWDVREAVNDIRAEKVPGLDNFILECLHEGGMIGLECFVRQLKQMF